MLIANARTQHVKANLQRYEKPGGSMLAASDAAKNAHTATNEIELRRIAAHPRVIVLSPGDPNA